MIKFTIKITDDKKGSCSVKLESPKKEDYEKVKSQNEKNCAIMVQQALFKTLKDLQNE